MVAVIKTSPSINNALYYNENKVKATVAELIHSSGFFKDTETLSFRDKIRHFQKLTQLNQRTKLNSVHISLNFDPSEKLSVETLKNISDSYMSRIGFGSQPYLVYQHHDSGHPHIHIVTTNIQTNGRRINMQNIGRNQSETARKEIEIDFNLVQADNQSKKLTHDHKIQQVQKAHYGKSETKRAITNVLGNVLHKYKYGSLPELNAVLKGYNIVADRGSKDSRIFKNNGLHYRILNDRGEKVGVPIKASALYNNPGMKFLSKRFVENQPLKLAHKSRTSNAIDIYFIKNLTPSLAGLNMALQKEGIQLVTRGNDQGVIYGMTYIDHQTKCVYNGSQLGKKYSANAIVKRCQQMHVKSAKVELTNTGTVPKFQVIKKGANSDTTSIQKPDVEVGISSTLLSSLTNALMSKPEGAIAVELLRETTQKRKKRHRNS